MSAANIARRDPIFGRIWRAIPGSVDPILREDIVSEVYLAIREGRLHPREIEAMAGRFIGAAFAAWANRWGALSLDVRSGEGEGAPTFAELVEDESALAAFDHIHFPHDIEPPEAA